MREILVVDSGWGNMHSISHAVEELGARVLVSADPEAVYRAGWAILPGVGAFGKASEALWHSGLADALRARAKEQKSTLGICLGMQLLFDSSEESPGARGLSILPGPVRLIRAPGLKIPHMGWNRLQRMKPCASLRGEDEVPYAYFVHSYAAHPDDPDMIAAQTDYAGPVVAIVESGEIWGMQFHPEKSGSGGMRMLDRFIGKEAF